MKKLMMLACVAMSVVLVAGCGSDETKSSSKTATDAVSAKDPVKSPVNNPAKDPYAKYLKQVQTHTNYPELELKVYRKAVKSIVDKCRSEGAMGEAMQDTAVMSAMSQLPPSFKMLKGTPNEKETLEQMVNELEF